METTKIISIRLPEWLLKALDDDAQREGLSRSGFIKQLYIGYKEQEIEFLEYIKAMAAEAAERN